MDVSTSSANNTSYETTKFVEKCSYTWTLPRFKKLKEKYKRDTYFKSPIFPDHKNKHRWEVLCFPNGSSSTIGCFCTLHLLSAKQKTDVSVEYYTSFRDSNDVMLKYHTKTTVFTKQNQFGTALELEEEKFRNLEDDIIKFYTVIKTEIVPKQLWDELTLSPEMKLAHDLKLAFKNKLYTDFAFKIKDYEIPAHRFVLISRSPVFRAMLKNDTSEKHNGFVEIKDMDKETVTLLLTFIYEGTIDNLSNDQAKKLLYAADKYDIMDLKDLCEDHLVDNLRLSNTIDFLVLADTHNANRLRTGAFNYIISNNQKFFKTKKLQTLTEKAPHLLFELTQKLLALVPYQYEILEPIHQGPTTQLLAARGIIGLPGLFN